MYLVVTELSTDLQLEYHKALFAGVEHGSVKLTTALLFMCSCVVFFCQQSVRLCGVEVRGVEEPAGGQ